MKKARRKYRRASRVVSKIDTLIDTRRHTHGDYLVRSAASQAIKQVFAEHGMNALAPVYRDTLDMIAVKVSRILSGQADYFDHWDDIAGYSQCASRACPQKPRRENDSE